MKTTSEIRQLFLEFFKTKNHNIVSSSSLVPHDDPTLLFTNAGMNQFKDVFLGVQKLDFNTASTAQRCLRAGGKHNDLENVGYTARHNTFFEMLGNFSFGAYFKREAISYAWEFLTSKEWLGLDKNLLYITVYHTDEEAFQIWQEVAELPIDHIIKIGDKGKKFESDNFWAMGDTGPCGPSTEIFYDHGEKYEGGLPGSPDEDGDRYIEIWNIVFMQFNRTSTGELEKLPKPSVDTGMGLERLAAVMQGVNSNYEVDTLQTLIKKTAEILKVKNLESASLKVIADHIRACAFLIADGVQPSNEGRGYVLRRIIRRALRHGHILGAKEAFFYKLLPTLIAVMGAAAIEVKEQENRIAEILKLEEESFSKTLDKGLTLLEEEFTRLKNNTLSGEVAFKLYDTFGFPFDLTFDLCKERGIKVDEEEFEKHMELQRKRAKQSNSFYCDYNNQLKLETISNFVGYTSSSVETKITALLFEQNQVEELKAGQQGVVVLENSPFYAEMGGQTGDQGLIATANAQFQVIDTQKQGNNILHFGEVIKGNFKIDDLVKAQVNLERQNLIRKNHSATHLLHSALREILGDHTKQAGSSVTDEMLRFDFTHRQGLSEDEILQIENLVNAKIRENISVVIQEMSLEEAKKQGATALFGEKYGNLVRVVTMSDFSKELCGGLHIQQTGEIGLFKIISESALASGVRRIEAYTAQVAQNWGIELQNKLKQIGNLIKSDQKSLVAKVEQLQLKQKQLEQEILQFKKKQLQIQINELANSVENIDDLQIIVKEVVNCDVKDLKQIADDLKNRLPRLVLVLTTVIENKLNLLVAVGKEQKLSAKDLLAQLAPIVEAKGGGRVDLATAGGGDVSKKAELLNQVMQIIKKGF